MHPNPHATSPATITLTTKQVEAINRLGFNGWRVELANFHLASDGMLEGMVETKDGYQMIMGIRPEGSTHT